MEEEDLLNLDKKNIDFKKVNLFFAKVKKIFVAIYNFFGNKEFDSKLMSALAFCSVVLALYFWFNLYTEIRNLQTKNSQLINLSTYDTNILQKNNYTKNFWKNWDNILDLTKENDQIKSDIERYNEYLRDLQIPYKDFLQYIYLPVLNIWKDKYTNQIDTEMMGIKFLQNNPYSDIVLIQKRSDFFKNVWENWESNEISDITIWDIIESNSWFFHIPVSVSFVSNSKRSFLLLVDKLSMTSSKENISSINEFFYYLRDQIKKDKSSEIKDLTKKYEILFWSWNLTDQNKIIWYHLYNRVFNNQENILIDNKIIDKTVKAVIACDDINDELCYYKFREKYRDIPEFGYLIWTDSKINYVQKFKDLLLNLPPVFSVKEFSFDKQNPGQSINAKNIQYKGQIVIDVYGKWISNNDIDEIWSVLWKKCFWWDDKVLSIQVALDLITSTLKKLSSFDKIDKSQNDNLWQLKNLLEKINSDYPNLTNYKKVIKLFEIYRMIDDAGLCW